MGLGSLLATDSLNELNACLRDLKALILKPLLNRDLTGILVGESVMFLLRTGGTNSRRK